ncbi:MAG TPA: hypothetical protein VNL71_19700 [Chloroflexota bacterium]|nr:hypothetical protein [Chloroflexota bacterium]
MRCEDEVHARLLAGERELNQLTEEIAHLCIQVKIGDEGWRDALERLAARNERRRALTAQLDSLRWVLLRDEQRIAS